MIVVTGAAGFIGSAIIWNLNKQGIHNIIAVDSVHTSSKWLNLRQLHYYNYLHKNEFLDKIKSNELGDAVTAIIHMGACSSTTEEDMDYLFTNNVAYSQILATYAVENNIRFIYASSAATYGNLDSPQTVGSENPENPYGYSKYLMDLFARKYSAKYPKMKIPLVSDRYRVG